MRAKTIHGNTLKDLEKAFSSIVTGSEVEEPFSPTLAIVFAPPTDDIAAISNFLDQNDIYIFGASSRGQFTEFETLEFSTTILLLDLHANHFRLFFSEWDHDSIRNDAAILGNTGLKYFKNPAFIISASNTELPANRLIDGLVEVVGEESIIVGGNATGKDHLSPSYVFTNKKISDKGFVAIILDADKIQIEGEAISGYKAVGTKKLITKSEGNWIYTIDHEPALDHLLKFTGIDIDEEDENSLYEKLGSIYPLQLQQKYGDPIMVPALAFNKADHSFMSAVPVEEGAAIRFSLPPDFEVIETVVDSARHRKEIAIKRADALIIFSCVGRIATLGPLIDEEIRGLVDVWKVPSIGFFTWGEYGCVKGGKPNFHGTTVSWVALKEIDS